MKHILSYALLAIGLVALINLVQQQTTDLLPETPDTEPQMITADRFTVDGFSGDVLVIAPELAETLPTELLAEQDMVVKKDLFIGTVLPIILSVNDGVREDRKRLKALRAQNLTLANIGDDDRAWLLNLAENNRVNSDALDINSLLDDILFHHDIVPPTLATAQAIIESGWGTSRFAQEGNALFGIWIWGDGDGMVPEKRMDGDNHKIKSYDSLVESVEHYILNLNRHYAYEEFRTLRAEARKTAGALTTEDVIAGLTSYSEKGAAYVELLEVIITDNDLEPLDSARLETEGTE